MAHARCTRARIRCRLVRTRLTAGALLGALRTHLRLLLCHSGLPPSLALSDALRQLALIVEVVLLRPLRAEPRVDESPLSLRPCRHYLRLRFPLFHLRALRANVARFLVMALRDFFIALSFETGMFLPFLVPVLALSLPRFFALMWILARPRLRATWHHLPRTRLLRWPKIYFQPASLSRAATKIARAVRGGGRGEAKFNKFITKFKQNHHNCAI